LKIYAPVSKNHGKKTRHNCSCAHTIVHIFLRQVD
jgi:hypothetical protein